MPTPTRPYLVMLNCEAAPRVLATGATLASGTAVEYEVRHPGWRVWAATAAALSPDVVGLYGRGFEAALTGPPLSTLIAEGSEVAVYPPSRVRA